MAKAGWLGAALVAMGMAGPLAAQELDPRVAGPLMPLINGAGMQCQAGNAQFCTVAQQLQQGAQELAQVQFACQQGNPQACQMFQMGAQQVMVAWQQNFGGGMQQQAPMPQGQAYSQQQQAFDHQQRMQQQQMMFQQQQQQYRQQQQANDLQHQRFMQQLRQ